MAEPQPKFFKSKDLLSWFPLSSETIRNWERQGKIPPSIRTLGGHRRYTLEHVQKLATLMGVPVPAAAL